MQDSAAAVGLEILGVFFGHNETFRGKVQDRLMQAELGKVRAAMLQGLSPVASLFWPHAQSMLHASTQHFATILLL